jgi:hypothetical protein
MATFNFLYSPGNAKVKETTALKFNDAAGGSLDFANIPVNFNSGATLTINTAVTLGGSATFDAGANVLSNLLNPSSAQDAATKAYVDARVALTDYTVVSATGLVIGKFVALDAANVLVLADKDADATANVIGVITAVNSLVITVASIGQYAINDLSSGFTVGEQLFIGNDGDAVLYSALASGDFATQVGYVSNIASDLATLQIRTFGEIA